MDKLIYISGKDFGFEESNRSISHNGISAKTDRYPTNMYIRI